VSGDFLFQAFVYLAAAVIAVPIAARLGLGSVLGYLLAGIVIGPFGLGLLGENGADIMHFAEFGVVMMLFLVGLELEPALLWRLRAPILGLGGLQVLVTSLVAGTAGLVLGLPWQQALAVGLILSLSSTAIVLQSLGESGLLKSPGGQASFAVLLFQDIAVIPMLAIFPLLAGTAVATTGAETHAEHAAATFVAGLPPWGQTLAMLLAVTVIVVAGRYLLRPVFRTIAATRLREVFVAAALLLVIGIALLMYQVGLSAALGAFLGGVVLANSEYRHELESDIEPFKGLLLGLFFLAVGASINFALIFAQPLLILGLVFGVIAVKFAILFALGRVFRLQNDQALLLAFSLPQVGEFAFVLFALGVQERVFAAGVADPLVAVVAISMALTPLLMLFYARVLRPRFVAEAGPERAPDAIDEQNPVIIAGFGAFGATTGRLLRANGIGVTVLDYDADRVELLRRMGIKVYYGDASRYDLLIAAGAQKARLLVLALDTPDRTLALVHTAHKHFPNLTIMARAFDWQDAHDLIEAGVPYVYRETVDTALRLGTDALRMLGFRGYQATRAAQTFLRHDEESVRELTSRRSDGTGYTLAARQRIADLENILQADLVGADLARDTGWDAESLREDTWRSNGA
jgi:CPA2 family monovalent cation:H+ antiporter-2/glutathione-regulated potassium-efflux system protein KefB